MNQQRALGLFVAARAALRAVKYNVSTFGMTEQMLLDAEPQTMQHTARAAISKEMVAIVENLNGLKDPSDKAKYPNIYDIIRPLTLQRNILTHQYGHAHTTIEWDLVWRTISQDYPNLENALEEAIAELDAKKEQQG